MKVFEKDYKINFVDDQNRFVGFDSHQSCCESFGWMLSREVPEKDKIEALDENGIDASKMQFDPEFFQSIDGGDYEGGVSFRLVDGEDVAYLTLFNHHNGYYSHGFEFVVNGETKRDGWL